MHESEFFVQPHGRAFAAAIADYCNDLAEAERPYGVDQFLHEPQPDAPSFRLRCDIHRILDDEPVGGPGTERSGIGITGDYAGLFRNEIWEARGTKRLETGGHLRLRGRVQFIA